MAYQSQDIIHRFTTNGLTPAPQARNFQEEVTKLIDVTTCIGCKACQVAYSERNDIHDTIDNSTGVYDSPNDLSAKSQTVIRFSEVEQSDKLEQLVHKDGRIHCSDPGYLKACPAERAIIQYANDIVDSQSKQYIGCGYYIAGCPFGIPCLNSGDNRVYKCTLCVDHVVVRQEPAYVKTCPTSVIHFGTKGPMKTLTSERVAGLKTRGYGSAGLYNPASIGDTHIMHVLHHADKPNLYHGLPEDPEISETMKFWKSTWEPLAAVGLATTFTTNTLHYVDISPSRVDEEEDSLHEEKDEERK